ncbi:uncharacterized protein [Clytia hemisphaerica]|uniref:uncharacterized protein isoform X2 n=1 Tax=Clytia hemisphaerica TaxID=252671 RepID=UPI0034D6222E
MEGIYNCSSSEKVLNLEKELEKELKDLQNEIEAGGVIGKTEHQSFSSVPIPNDAKFFRKQRKIAVKNCLKVREAKPLLLQSELMKEEVDSCLKSEYTNESIPVLLHQFFVERVKELSQLKILHMKRWTRFCHYTKERETVYPQYKKSMDDILLECQDAYDRASRLSVCCEPLITSQPIPISMIKSEDLAIYTRWFVYYLHSIKKITHFIKVIEWLPQTKFLLSKKHDKLEEKKTVSNSNKKFTSRDESNGLVSPRFLSPRSFWKRDEKPTPVSETSKDIKPLPSFSTEIEDFSKQLDVLLANYDIKMRCHQVENQSDGMDMYNLVIRKFKQHHFIQEQNRLFPIYDSETLENSKETKEKGHMTYKKESNWLAFIQILPDVYNTQKAALTKLKEQDAMDQLMFVQSKILSVKSSDKVLYLLKEHAKQIGSDLKTSSSTSLLRRNTKDVWSNVFNFKRPQSARGGNNSGGYEENLSSKGSETFDKSSGSGENGGGGGGEFDITEAVHKLGLEDDDSTKTHSFNVNGALLSLMLLRHLKIKDHRRTVLNTLNYFRSVERTLTINDVGFSAKESKIHSSSYKPHHEGVSGGIGDHQYTHNTPVDYIKHQFNTLQDLDVENYDDFYSIEDNLVHVQDQKGWLIMYDAALKDFGELESEMMLIATHYLEAACQDNEDAQSRPRSSHKREAINLDYYGLRNVDRFAVLYDLWQWEMKFQEKKRQLLDCFLEAYHHITNEKEAKKMCQVLVNIMYQRPRFNFTHGYFIESYQLECKLLEEKCKIIKLILDDHIQEQRHYTQIINRDEKRYYGMPGPMIPVQAISVNTSRPVLKDIFMLEFHPTISTIAAVPSAILKSHRELIHMFQPESITDEVNLELSLVLEISKEWTTKDSFGNSYSAQTRKDVFSEIFIEDPMFVCEIGDSLTAQHDSRGTHNKRKEEIKKMLNTWSKLLEIITNRHRLLENINETDILHNAYIFISRKIGVDECHLHLRPVSFEYAQAKTNAKTKPLSLKELLDDESRVDRYIPNNSSLGISELDEKHVSVFNFRNREGLINLVSTPNSSEKVRAALSAQICQKFLLMSAVQQVNGSYNEIRSEEQQRLKMEQSSFLIGSSRSSSQSLIKTSLPSQLMIPMTQSQQMFNENLINDKLKRSFLSLQAEKLFYRDRMLNGFVKMKEKKQPKTMDEIVRMKLNFIQEYCASLQTRFSQHLCRGQLISYFYSMKTLLKSFPVTRDVHFMCGHDQEEETGKDDEEKKKEVIEDEIVKDPTRFKQRPKRFLSLDGKRLLNLWYIPHYSEVLQLFENLSDKDAGDCLVVMLRIVASLHDICQYLCAHARSGSSHARMGSHKLETSSITADWGGTEGIGAELREIQKQIDKLENPFDPDSVATFLKRKRDIIFMEYDVTISHSVRNTFLQSGNQTAYQSITNCMKSALQDLSNRSREIYANSRLSVPDPLEPSDSIAKTLFPWRSFLGRYVSNPMSFFDLSYVMQIPLFELKNIDKHLVHGEILGVSLLLEDVVSTGIPKVSFTEPQGSSNTDLMKRPPNSRISSRPPSSRSRSSSKMSNPTIESPKKSFLTTSFNMEKFAGHAGLSWQHYPMQTSEVVYNFLLLWSRLEIVRREWGCRRLKITSLSTVKSYDQFQHLYNLEILQPVYHRILTSREGSSNKQNRTRLRVAGDEEISLVELPDDVTEYEIKGRQLVRLLEHFECMMIDDCIRRISRQHTAVVSERHRDDHNMPTDLWKRPSMKENVTIPRAHLVEDFARELLADSSSNDNLVTLERDSLDHSLVTLATAITNREKMNFLSCSMFYENLLRQQNNALYTKERHIKRLEDTIEQLESKTSVEIDCALAERSYELLIEITALRSKIADLEKWNNESEMKLDERYRQSYNDMVLDLFQNAFGMKMRFENFRLKLHDDVMDFVQEVRKISVDKLQKVRNKHGYQPSNDNMSARLIQAEKIREVQRENKKLTDIVSKQRTMHTWFRSKSRSKFELMSADFQSNTDKATKENLEKEMLQEQKSSLMKEEQEALKKILINLDQECSKLRQQLDKEHKIQAQRSHLQLKEEQSSRHLEMARASNLDKLLQELEEREKELKQMRDSQSPDNKQSARSSSETKRLLRQAITQVSHERSLKLDAFERVDELQKHVNELENRITDMLSKEKQTFHETCFPMVPGGRTSPQKLRPISQAANIALAVEPPQRPRTSRTRPKSGVPARVTPRSKSVMELLKQQKSCSSLNKNFHY